MTSMLRVRHGAPVRIEFQDGGSVVVPVEQVYGRVKVEMLYRAADYLPYALAVVDRSDVLEGDQLCDCERCEPCPA